MNEIQSNLSLPLTQALTSLPFQETIDHLAQSPRGDLREIAALLTMEPECAELDPEIAPASPVPLPAAADPDDDAGAVDLCVTSREVAAYRKLTGQPHPIPPQYRASGRASRRSLPKRGGIPAKPNNRPARACVPHSRTSHGGGQKRDSDSGGPPGTAPTRFYVRPDGTVRLEQDDGPDYVISTEFGSIGEAVQCLLDFEVWAKANGTWIGPSHLDPDHPLYPIICGRLN
jgi:hypothetical protein